MPNILVLFLYPQGTGTAATEKPLFPSLKVRTPSLDGNGIAVCEPDAGASPKQFIPTLSQP